MITNSILLNMIGNIEPYVPGNDFHEYLERLKHIFVFNEVSVAKKVAFFLTFIGPEAYSVLNKLLMLIPADPASKWYESSTKTLKDHFAPNINKISERFKFHKQDQKQGQSIAEYVVDLKVRASRASSTDF